MNDAIRSGLGGWRGWERFFFAPADPTTLGLIRIVAGGLAFWSLAVTGLDLQALLGAGGWVEPETALVMRPPGSSAWSFWLALPEGWIVPAYVASLVILAAFTLGLAAPVTGVLAWAIVSSTSRRAPGLVFGFDQILSTVLLYLAATFASGQALSLDRLLPRWWRFRREARRARPGAAGGPMRLEPASGAPAPSVAANLALRLMQIHLVIIYAMSGMAKLQGEMWWDGTAVWPTLVDREFAVIDLTGLASFPALINVLTHATVAVELGYAFLIWRRAWRPWLLAAVAGMHLGIGLALGLIEFGLAMLALNLAFVPGAWLRSLVTRRSARVLYDGACPRCRGSMALAKAVDPGRVAVPVDLLTADLAAIDRRLDRGACLRAMHAVTDRGEIKVGYDAVAWLARRLPLFWPVAWVTWVPGVAAVGRRVYNLVAANRARQLACTDEVCAVP